MCCWQIITGSDNGPSLDATSRNSTFRPQATGKNAGERVRFAAGDNGFGSLISIMLPDFDKANSWSRGSCEMREEKESIIIAFQFSFETVSYSMFEPEGTSFCSC